MNSELFQLAQRRRLTAASLVRHFEPTERARDAVIVWLWDAPGALSAACGVSGDQASARQAASDCLASGDATVATLQAAELMDGPDALDPHYARFGCRWQATRTRSGAIRWREFALQPQPAPLPPTEFGNSRRTPVNFFPPPPVPAGVDVTRPHPARMYDYYLGGKDHWLSDRNAAEQVLAAVPEVRAIARVILSFRVSRCRDLRRPVMDGVADGTPAGRSQCYWWN